MTPGSVQLHDRPNQCLSVGVSNATNEVKVVLLSMKSGYNLRSPVFPCCAEVIAAASPVALLQGGRTRFTRHKGGGTPVVQRPLTFRTTTITSRLVGFPVCPFRGVDASGATGDQRGHQLMDWEQFGGWFGDLICGGRLVRAGSKQRGWGGGFCFPGISAVGLSTAAAADLPDLRIHLTALPQSKWDKSTPRQQEQPYFKPLDCKYLIEADRDVEYYYIFPPPDICQASSSWWTSVVHLCIPSRRLLSKAVRKQPGSLPPPLAHPSVLPLLEWSGLLKEAVVPAFPVSILAPSQRSQFVSALSRCGGAEMERTSSHFRAERGGGEELRSMRLKH